MTSTVEHILLEVVCNLESEEDAKGEFLLQVAGTAEYLQPDCQLQDFEYVHECYKYDRDPEFVLVPAEQVERPYLRTVREKTREMTTTTMSLYLVVVFETSMTTP